AQARQQAEVIIHKGEPPQGTRPSRLQGARHRVKLLARQPIIQMIEHAPPIVAHDLEWQMVDLIPQEGDFRRPAQCPLQRFGIGIDIEKSQERKLAQIAQMIKKAAAKLAQGTPSKAAQPDNDRSEEHTSEL